MEDKQKSFEEVARPLIKWLCENANPHSTIIIDSTHAELLSGDQAVQTDEYLVD